MSFYERLYFPKSKKRFFTATRRGVCILLAIVSLLGAAALIIGLVIPELVSCIKFLISEIPPAVDKVLKTPFIAEILPDDILSSLKNMNWKEYLTNSWSVLSSGIGDAATIIFATVSSVFTGIVTAFISIIFTIYLLIDRDRLKGHFTTLFTTYVPEKITKKTFYCLGIFNNCFRRFIVGQCTEAVILGMLCCIGMLIFRFPYAGMISALIGFTALIPIAGAYIGAAVGALMMLTVSPVKALFFLIFIIVLQQLEGNLIYPKVVGKSIGLPALWVLAAVTVGGSLMGIGGMLIGVPITAALYRIIREDVRKRKSAVDEKREDDVSDSPNGEAL